MIDIKDNLQRISQILKNHPGDSAEWVASLQKLYDNDTDAFYKQLNSKRMWGGACSIANQALADNPGMDEWSWKMQIRELRELMIELGMHLQTRANPYPDVGTWLMAFSNWNQSDI